MKVKKIRVVDDEIYICELLTANRYLEPK